MVKILIICSTLQKTGPTNQLFGIVKHIKCVDFTPHIITLSSESKDNCWSKFANLGIRLSSLSLGKFESLYLAKQKLLTLVDTIRPDIIHTQGIRSDTLSALFLKRYPRLVSLRNIPRKDYSMTYGPLRGLLMATWHIQMLRRVTLVAAVSQYVQTHCNLLGIQAFTIYNGVTIDNLFPIRSDQKLQIRKSLALPQEAFISITVGDLSHRKDPRTIIRAFLNSKQQGLLLIVGKGKQRDELFDEYGGNERIRFVGHQSNVAPWLQASDLFISASTAEGLPNSVLEALACGLPCVLSDIPPHREILRHDQDAGVLYPVGDQEALSIILREVNFTDINKNAARQIVTNHFDAKSMSKKYQELYLSMVEKSSPWNLLRF